MKQEEQILRALGAVKDRYVLEAAPYAGSPQQPVLVKPKRRSRKGFGVLAAAAAVVVTGALGLMLLSGQSQPTQPPFTNTLLISRSPRNTVRQVTFVTDGLENPRPIRQIRIYNDQVVQTIEPSTLPPGSEGLFLSQVPIDQLPSAIPGCNMGLFFYDEQGRSVRTDVDFRDVNFDGYSDLGLAAVAGYPENLAYHYFLWNPETEQYDYGFRLNGGPALELEPQNQLLIERVVESGVETQRYYRWEEGTLQQADQGAVTRTWRQADQPAFCLTYDPQRLELAEGIGRVFLRPWEYSPELPVSELKIEFLPGLLPYAAMEKSRAELGGGQVHQDPQTGRYTFTLSQGSSWNSTVEEVTIVGAGSQGSYRLRSRYFTEATEGWGALFSQVCQSFTCPLEESPNPQAEQVIMDFAEGFFSGNQVAMLRCYYSDSNNLRDVYTQDASRVQLAFLQGLEELDDRIEKDGFAHVSLAFLETEQADSYTYLSMDVMETQAGYRITFYGLEK